MGHTQELGGAASVQGQHRVPGATHVGRSRVLTQRKEDGKDAHAARQW